MPWFFKAIKIQSKISLIEHRPYVRGLCLCFSLSLSLILYCTHPDCMQYSYTLHISAFGMFRARFHQLLFVKHSLALIYTQSQHLTTMRWLNSIYSLEMQIMLKCIQYNKYNMYSVYASARPWVSTMLKNSSYNSNLTNALAAAYFIFIIFIVVAIALPFQQSNFLLLFLLLDFVCDSVAIAIVIVDAVIVFGANSKTTTRKIWCAFCVTLFSIHFY